MSENHSLPGPGRIADTCTYDGAVSQLVQIADGTVLLFYHLSQTGHVAPDGRLVVRRSSDNGNTWSNPKSVIEKDGIDPSSFSIVHHPSYDRIIVFAVGYAFKNNRDNELFPDREFVAAYKIVSTDGGRTWGELKPVDQYLTIETVVPFGGSVLTSSGLLTAFQSDTHKIEILISGDDGKTWGNNVFVTGSPEGHQLAEPVPCAVTPEKTIIFGRDNETGGVYAIRSRDGGLSWESPIFFNLTQGETPNPIWIKRTGANELTAVWGDRTDRCVYQVSISAQLAWQSPPALSEQHRKCLHRQIGHENKASYWDGDAGDFGYPTFIELGDSRSDYLLVCYDEDERPNLWQMALMG